MNDVANHEVIQSALVRMGLVAPGERPQLTALAGGVSSEIYRVDLAAGPICVKRALPQLKVTAVWKAPLDRNRYEVAWLRAAAAIVPEFVPEVLSHDSETGSFAMAYLEPARYPVWKWQLRDGLIDETTAVEVALRICAVHAATAGDAEVARCFATDAIFHAIRLDPYLLATAAARPEVAAPLERLAETTAATKRALVHGDVSPKNILVGPNGPILLDAECAWYGDPAFDLAFCLNHMLLKALWRPQWRERYLACFHALKETYLAGVTWEDASEIEERAGQLLPGLFLGRVDGKSPVEYVTAEADKERVRRVARTLLLTPPTRLSEVAAAWRAELVP